MRMAQSNTNFVFLLFILVFGSFFSSSMAQKRTTVVVNSETNNNNVLDFNLKQLPVNAHFEENSFRLTLDLSLIHI